MNPLIYPDQDVTLSVVLPVYNAAQNILLAYRRLKAVTSAMDIRCELLFVDDGSRDGTRRDLENIARRDPTVSTLFLGAHHGKESALAAGLAQAKGQAIIIMDVDLRDPPELIPDMVATWASGADVVRMRRKPAPGGPLSERLLEWCRNHLQNAMGYANVPGCSFDFMLYSHKAATALSLLVDRKRYMASMFTWMRLNQAIIDYERQPSAASGYKWRDALS